MKITELPVKNIGELGDADTLLVVDSAQKVTMKMAADVFKDKNANDIAPHIRKAEQWADQDTDLEVEPGRFSAKHGAQKAADAQAATETARDDAYNAKAGSELARDASQNARDVSAKYANEDEDVEVATGQYSSRHYSLKARQEKEAARQIKTDTDAIRTATGLIRTDVVNLKDQTSGLKTDAEVAAASANDSDVSAQDAATNAASAQYSAEIARDAAMSHRDAAQLAETGSVEAKDIAQRWASESPGTQVEPGRYSARHWAYQIEMMEPLSIHNNLSDLTDVAQALSNLGIDVAFPSLQNGKIPLTQLPDLAKQQTFVVADSVERDAITGMYNGDRCYEVSTGDSYIYDGASWRVLAKADWENINIDWSNIINVPALSTEGHDHDVRYYTKSAVDILLQGKSDDGHTHDNRYYTELEVDNMLDLKSDATHSHDARYYTKSAVDTIANAKLDEGAKAADSALLEGAAPSVTPAGNSIVKRDSNGDINGRYVSGTYFSQSHSQATRNSDTVFYSSNDNYVRKNTREGFVNSLNVVDKSDAEIDGHLKLDTGHSWITLHDGFGNLNIKCGLDPSNMPVAGTGGSHIQMGETGGINLMSYYGDPEGATVGTAACVFKVLNGYAEAKGHLRPSANNAYDLGNSSNYWRKVYGTAIEAQYADLAEKYTCATKKDDLPYGTVLSIPLDGKEEVEICDEVLCDRVVGVHSEKPATLMNSQSFGVACGLTGKVPVRVLGPVKKGDSLVSAGNGCARVASGPEELVYKLGNTIESSEVETEKLVMCIVK